MLFGGCTNSEPQQPIVPQSLILEPGDRTIALGQEMVLEALVDPSGTWGFQWTSSGGNLSATGADATFVAPDVPGEVVITVALPGEDLEDSITVTVKDQRVTLASANGSLRMATGTDLELSAFVIGSESEQLVWQSSGGLITASGHGAVFTAPDEPGDYFITASLPENDWVVGSLSIEVPGAILEPFTIAVIPDTQTLVLDGDSNGLIAGISDWLVGNAELRNIAFVTHLGDVVWGDNWRATVDTDAQWDAAVAGLDPLDGAIPYSVSLGDHEYVIEEDKNSSTAAYFEHFGPARYADYDWYRGSHEEGLSHYQIFEAGGREFLHLNLEWEPLGPADDESTPLGWARKVLEDHPQLPTLISTHAYLWDKPNEEGHFPDSAKEGFLGTQDNIAPDTASGVGIFEALVEPFPQVLMVFNGHYHKAEDEPWRRGEYHQTSRNAAGLEVYEMLSNYQWMKYSDDPDWIRLIEFQPGVAGGPDHIEVSTFSPSRGDYKPGLASNFTYELDLAERIAVE